MVIQHWQMVQKGEFNGVGENSVHLCTNPCPSFMTLLRGSVLRPDIARVRNSNPVSGGQSHLIHLTILGRFSWLSLAYMRKKVA